MMRYVQKFKDRHGKWRHYFRRKGYGRIPLPGQPGSDDFMVAYQSASGIATIRKTTVATINLRETGNSVYFLMYGNARGAKVKIGTCKNVKNRLAGLRAGVPGKARIHYVTPGSTGLERELHRKFAEDRVSGEWFRYSQAIRDWIEQDKERRAKERGWQNSVRTSTFARF